MVAALVAIGATAASAHPLGNFSVNRWAGLEAGPASLRIHYAVDFAEIPTLQEASEGVPRADELAMRLRDGLHVDADGRALTLHAGESAVSFAPGAAGLRTMRFESTYDAALPEGGGRIAFRDDNFTGRVGWREVIAWGGRGVSVVSSSVPARDRSARLTSYPRDLLQAPRHLRGEVVERVNLRAPFGEWLQLDEDLEVRWQRRIGAVLRASELGEQARSFR